jgi:hypothetical protein
MGNVLKVNCVSHCIKFIEGSTNALGFMDVIYCIAVINMFRSVMWPCNVLCNKTTSIKSIALEHIKLCVSHSFCLVVAEVFSVPTDILRISLEIRTETRSNLHVPQSSDPNENWKDSIYS